jgi:RND family efflux transporter MFP subunit
MPSPDPTDRVPPSARDEQSHGEYPDQVSRDEGDQGEEGVTVSTRFSQDTGRRTKRGVGFGIVALAVLFVIVCVVRFLHSHSVAKASETAYSAPPPVDKWLVDIGDHVYEGQVLAVIETPELDAELEAARAQLKSSQSQVVARQAEAEFSKTTNERWRDSPKGVVSEQERESKKADYESAVARLYTANAQVNLDKSKVDQYAALAEFKEVKAPFDGTITERKIDVGNLVTAGSGSTTTPLYRMAQTDPLRIFVEVPQSAAGELMYGGVPAEIRAPGAIGDVFAGKIARSAQSINTQARTMRVEVDMPNANHRLVPGMYVNVAFSLPPRGQVEVPAAALIFRATGTQVAHVDDSGKISFEAVSIARDNGSLVELSSGVKSGDRLVLNISSQIAAGQTVAVNQPESEQRPLGAKR